MNIFDEALKKVEQHYKKITEVEYLEEVKQYIIDEGEPSDCLSLEEIQQEIMEAKLKEFKKGIKFP